MTRLPSLTVLVAHKIGLKFDPVILLHHIQVLQLETAFKGRVVGLADSLPLLKAAFPSRAFYILTALSGEGFDARNTIGEIEAMAAVMAKFRLREKDVLRDAKTAESRCVELTIEYCTSLVQWQ